MQIFHETNNDVISFLAEKLQEGKVIAFPTETVFGLMCDATNSKAVDRIFQIKRRSIEKTLAATFPSDFLKKENFVLHKKQEIIFEEHLNSPPVTIITKFREKPWNLDSITPESGEIGVRITNFKPFLDLVNKFGKPIAQTSMNISGKETAKTPTEFLSQLLSNGSEKNLMPDFAVEIIIPPNRPSRIIRILESGEIEIIR